MPTVDVCRINLKEILRDADVAAYWKFIQEEFISGALTVQGVRSVKRYSGAGVGASRTDMLTHDVYYDVIHWLTRS